MSPEKPEEPSRKRAAATLGVVADADAFAVRSAFFRKLIAFDFVPPQEWIAAATRLGAALPVAVAASETIAEYEMADVEDFLRCYWSLAPEDRMARWEELDARSRDAEARAALKRVKEGLSIVVRAHHDAALEKLSQTFRELSLLTARELAIRRLQLSEDNSSVEMVEMLRLWFRAADPVMAELARSAMGDYWNTDPARQRVSRFGGDDLEVGDEAEFDADSDDGDEDSLALSDYEPSPEVRVNEVPKWVWVVSAIAIIATFLLLTVS